MFVSRPRRTGRTLAYPLRWLRGINGSYSIEGMDLKHRTIRGVHYPDGLRPLARLRTKSGFRKTRAKPNAIPGLIAIPNKTPGNRKWNISTNWLEKCIQFRTMRFDPITYQAPDSSGREESEVHSRIRTTECNQRRLTKSTEFLLRHYQAPGTQEGKRESDCGSYQTKCKLKQTPRHPNTIKRKEKRSKEIMQIMVGKCSAVESAKA